MTGAKHTPGPWRLAGKYKGDHGSFWLETEFPMPVFELVPVVGVPSEHLANARLVAAAPELLEALKETLPFMIDIAKARHPQFEPTMADDDSAIGKAMRAIAKAEGRP